MQKTDTPKSISNIGNSKDLFAYPFFALTLQQLKTENNKLNIYKQYLMKSTFETIWFFFTGLSDLWNYSHFIRLCTISRATGFGLPPNFEDWHVIQQSHSILNSNLQFFLATSPSFIFFPQSVKVLGFNSTFNNMSLESWCLFLLMEANHRP